MKNKIVNRLQMMGRVTARKKNLPLGSSSAKDRRVGLVTYPSCTVNMLKQDQRTPNKKLNESNAINLCLIVAKWQSGSFEGSVVHFSNRPLRKKALSGRNEIG